MDIAIVALTVVFAVNGYRQGLLVGLLSLMGFFGGVLLGLRLGPWLAEYSDDDSTRVMISLFVVFGLAVAGQALTSLLGGRLRSALRNRVAQRFDDVGGSIISVVTALAVVWLIAVPLGSSSLPWLAKSVRNSSIIGAVNKVMPAEAHALSDTLRDTVDTRGFPDVFGGLSPTKVRDVPAPDPALTNSLAVQKAKQSVVKVRGAAQSCSRNIEGTGFVYAPGRVMTNAHVVAGTRSVTVELAETRYNARVVVYDPARDLAVLYAPRLKAPVLPFAPHPAASESDAVVVGFPLDGPFDAQAARVRDLREITGPDIYESGNVTREIYTIRALVRSGNSGGPLMATDGTVLGVIFAAAADDPQTGFALTAGEAAATATLGAERTEATGTQHCA
ncbi:MAG: MarP family serine protease [Dactylosporangium sp.]|nr:MarP family serine protease [Dactylosporangium sp.]NNJ63243.1 MarP family serine protease [Dactylosporangium sp.]